MLKSADDAVVVDAIPVEMDVSSVIKEMHLHGDSRRYEGHVRDLLEVVSLLARPKAMYKVCRVRNRNEDSLEICDVRFDGRLIRDVMEGVDTVFACVVTCGREVERVEIPSGDIMKRYSLDIVKMALVFNAAKYLSIHLKEKYGLDEIYSLNPGEIRAFPSSQHRLIFSILGDVKSRIGVELTENCALVPTKSLSGIYFPRETPFISCRMCTQKRCMGRRAAYDPEMAGRYQ
ncbi:MAG: hypothetical protein JXA46_16370 [Dehalococcoidales bacterium]|nr:hypothetical protein [Dehalococcoidales bacterium]